jgi:hypothetical protein
MRVFFPGVRFIHIVRNGFNAVYSALSRGWYTDDFCNSDVVQGMIPHFSCDIPPYIERDCRDSWPDWNTETRAACAWRCSVAAGIRFKHSHPDECLQFRYEDFISKPWEYVMLFERWTGLTDSDLTCEHVDNIINFEIQTKDSVYRINKISEPERSKFLELNRILNYEA